MRILFLGDNLANAKHWKNAMRQVPEIEICEWELNKKNRFKRIAVWLFIVVFGRFYFKRFDADMVIGYRTTSYGFIAACSGIKPLVIAAQGEKDIWPETGWLVPFKTFIRNHACNKADLIHAWGAHMKKSLLIPGVDEHKILICPRGVDIKLFNYVSWENKMSKVPTFVSTRSLFPEYQFSLIIQAFCLLDLAGVDFRFNIIGDGAEMGNLKSQIVKAKLDGKICLLGEVCNERLPKILSVSNFYISMPITEGVSASLFEAMASGCFPIVSDLPANRLFITHNVNGLLVNEFSPEVVYNQIKIALDENEWIKKATLFNRNLVEEKADLNKNIPLFITYYKNLFKTII